MKAEVLEHSIEEETSKNIFALIEIRCNEVGPLHWIISPSEFDDVQGWVTMYSGIGHPGGSETDLSSLTREQQIMLLGDGFCSEDIQELEDTISNALEKELKPIRNKISALFLKNIANRDESEGY